MSNNRFFYLTCLSEGFLLCLAVMLGWYFNLPFWSQLEFDVIDIILGISLALIFATFAIWALKSNWAIFTQLRNDTLTFVKILENLSVGSIILVALAAGVCEEVLFRGGFQPLFMDWLGLLPGLVLASLLFGLFHMISVSYVIYVSVFGLILGCMYIWSGNLIGPIIAHFIYDLIMLYWALHIQWPAQR